MGLVVQDVTLHGDGFAPADVGRIAHNEVEGGRGIGGTLRFGHDVAVEESDVGTQRLGVAARHAEGRFGNVPSRERGRGQTEGEAHSDAAAAGAGIEEVGRLVGSQFRGPLHQSLRFGTGDEHIGGDGKGVPVKFGTAQDILHRHAAAEGFEVGGPLLFVERSEQEVLAQEGIGVGEIEAAFEIEARDGLCFALVIVGNEDVEQLLAGRECGHGE